MSLPALTKMATHAARLLKAPFFVFSVVVFGGAITFFQPAPGWAATNSPIYIHMNGANEFLERLVFVRPREKVVFVNEDTGAHGIRGYNPRTGAQSKTFYKAALHGTPGAHHAVHTYSISFAHLGVQHYYCPIHAYIAKGPGGVWLPVRRSTTNGFGAAMAGVIVVTKDKALLADNPKTASMKILPKFFGG